MDTPNHYLNHYRKALETFVVFTDDEWLLFSQGLHLKTIKKKSYFIKAGEVCDTIGFVINGALRCYHLKDGEEITSYFCLENDLLSAYKSFITQQPSITCIQALEDTQLIIFTHRQLQQWMSMPIFAFKMERFGRLVAEFLICCYEDRVTSFVTESPEERYIKFLSTGKNIIQRIPQHYIANYLGITPVSLSRIRKRILVSA